MNRLRFGRVHSLFSASTSGRICPRPTVLPGGRNSLACIDGALENQRPGKGDRGSSNSGSASCFSTNAKRYEDIPKRIYESAPKRRHGKRAGMRPWSTPGSSKELVIEQDEAVEGETLALGSASGAEERREVSTSLKEIRVSPWSLNLLAKLVRGLPVVDASAQLQFCKKKHTGTVLKAMQNALNLADMRYGLAAEQLMVGEVFVTKGHVVKKMRIMGRGRAGISTRKWSHLNLTLREIDFDEQIRSAETKRRREKLQARKEEVENLILAREE